MYPATLQKRLEIGGPGKRGQNTHIHTRKETQEQNSSSWLQAFGNPTEEMGKVKCWDENRETEWKL
jgi:hypothetical protein